MAATVLRRSARSCASGAPNGTSAAAILALARVIRCSIADSPTRKARAIWRTERPETIRRATATCWVAGRSGRQQRRPALLAHPVQGGVAADQDQPGGRVARRTVLGPGLQGAQAGVLERLLSDVQIAEITQQGRYRLRPRGGQGGVDPGRVDI